ncbi:CHASE domain-containing protein [Massilia sp. 2TAF26]|uniref:CHASE domain-containing protein n=1 Tax=Massilia sp. 2TAF26 TaxID=3233012 RepID=UPI003F9C4C73
MPEASTRNMGKTVGASGPMRIALWAGGLCLALLVGAALYLGAARTADDEAQRRFDGIAQGARQRLDGAVQSYTQVVRNLAGLFNANGGEVSRLQFHRYVESLNVREHYPAIVSVNYGAWVPDAQREAFVAAVRADRSMDPRGYPEFDIKPPGRRPAYLVLNYMEPTMASRFGVDMLAAGPDVARTVEESRDRGEMAASGKPVQIETPRRYLGLGLRFPVYRGGAMPADLEARRAAFLGSVGIGFSIPDLVQGALAGMGRHPVTLQLYAAAETQPPAGQPLAIGPADTLLYDSADGHAPQPRAQGGDGEPFETVLPVRFQGNLWKARFLADGAELVDGFGRWFPRLASVLGAGATLLIYALFLKLYWSRRQAVEQRVLLDLVLDNVDAYVYMKDRERRFSYVNAKMAQAAGLRAEEMVARRDREVLPQARADEVWELDRPVLETGQGRSVQHEAVLADGSVRQLWSVKVPVRAAGEVAAVLCVSTDVTDLHQLKARADAASQAKTDFLSNMSHEIRTPMNSIIGMSYLALKQADEPRQRDYLQKIHHSAQHLLGIINHILDFSKIEAGRVELELLDFTLDALMRNLANQLGEAAAARGLSLEFEIAPELQRPLRGDPLRLEQVLLNFTSNAIKFSEQGRVLVRASVLRTLGAETLVRFEVRDRGIGIAFDELPKLFAPFHQADPSTTRCYGGTGLGLVISKQLAELMGGEVGVDSTPGEGSTFWFTARLASPADAAAAARRASTPAGAATAGPGALAGSAILLVEDNAFNQQVAQELLEDAGARVTVAGNGSEALALMRERGPHTPFDCVLMDVQMPVMDGFEATRRIRADAQLKDTRVIAMTANAGLEDQARCLAAGMDEFVTKPVAPEALIATVARALGRSVQRAVAAHVPAAPANTPALLDMDVLADTFAGNPDKMRKYAFMFLETAREGLLEIDRALASGEVGRAAGVAHRIKSSARTVGALGFGEVCADLEAQRERGSIAQARSLAARLRALLARLERHVAAELGARQQDQKV